MANCKYYHICDLNAEADSEGLCILHSANPDKDKKRFAEKFEQYRKYRGGNFSFFVFPERIDFRETTFTEEVNFWGARFYEGADFRRAAFIKGVSFSETTFTKGADFIGATFTKGVPFRRATFTKDADFSGAEFTEIVDFRDATFTKKASFLGAKFNKVADFSGATFTKKVDFRDATFNEGAHFKRATFTKGANFSGAPSVNEADFDHATFTEVVDFRRANFIEDAKFVDATFAKGANFSEATFAKGANFSEATFTKGADFSLAKFTEGADFSLAKFTEGADFMTAKFIKHAYFTQVNFTKRAEFASATFTEGAYFTLAKFTGEASFKSAIFTEKAQFFATNFTKGVDFGWATFMRDANFDGTIFEGGDAIFSKSHLLGRTLFLGEKDDSKGKRNLIFSKIEVKTYFNDVVITPSSAVIFRDADLSRCSFLGTRVDRVEFTNVKWAVIRGKFRYSRVAIYDEVMLRDSIKNKKKSKKKDKKNLNWEHIERFYRDLKINYISSGDHERAGDFHYGEKEMRRRNPSTPRMHCFFLNLYRILGGYGEQYTIPLFWAFFILVGCTIGYLAFGIGTADGLSLGFKDSFAVLLYSLQVMTLLRPTELQPIGVTSTAIKVFQSISGPIILGLFALALRQRLKR